MCGIVISSTYAVQIGSTFIYEELENEEVVSREVVKDKKTLCFSEQSQAVAVYASLIAAWTKDEIDGKVDRDWSEVEVALIKIDHLQGGEEVEEFLDSQYFSS